MAKLVHYTGKGKGRMQGVIEYIVLMDDDADNETVESYVAPGFKVDTSYTFETDIGDTEWPCALPTDRALIVQTL